jgi:hypothetical protein
MSQDMKMEVFNAIRDAVNLAKLYNVRTVGRLKSHLIEHGHTEENATAAIQEWAKYEKRKGA